VPRLAGLPSRIMHWDDRSPPDDDEVVTVARAWLNQAAGGVPDSWAVEAMMDAVRDAPPGDLELPWRLLLALFALVDPDDEMRISEIAAGPLENFVMMFGDDAMDLIEPAAATKPVLLRALAGVWARPEPVGPRIDRVLAAHGQEPL
jgi:hypothetical protein